MSPARRRALLAAALAGLLARSPAGTSVARRRRSGRRAPSSPGSPYRRWLSPALGAAGVRCRFEPSCSRYAEGAIRSGGALVGTARALGRIARCGPWTPAGTVDPP